MDWIIVALVAGSALSGALVYLYFRGRRILRKRRLQLKLDSHNERMAGYPQGGPSTERYWGQTELEEAIAKGRAEAADGPMPDQEIDYPVCEDCGKRHPHEAFLRHNGQAICERCGWVGDSRSAVLELPDGTRAPNTDPDRSVTDPVAHKNPQGRWCMANRFERRMH